MLSARMGYYGFADQVAQRLGSRRAALARPPADTSSAAACGQACSGMPPGSAGGAPNTVSAPLGTTAWFSGVGQWAQVASGAAPGFQSSLAGVMAGLDANLAPGFVGGFAVGGGSANTFSWNGATALGSALQVALYGEYGAGPFFAGGQVAYALLDQTTARPLGAWNSVARNSLTSSGVGGQVAAGARVPWNDWQFEPTLGFSALGLWAPTTVEQNAVGLAQQIYGQTLTSLRSAVTLPVSRTLSLAGDRLIRVRGLLGWAHEFADVNATTQATFVQAPTAPFSATSASIARDSLLLGLSGDLGLADGVVLSAGWQAALGGRSSVQTARVGLRFAF